MVYEDGTTEVMTGASCRAEVISIVPHYPPIRSPTSARSSAPILPSGLTPSRTCRAIRNLVAFASLAISFSFMPVETGRRRIFQCLITSDSFRGNFPPEQMSAGEALENDNVSIEGDNRYESA